MIVSCGPKNHQVRLATGRRFFAKARCPKCATEIDPKRLDRVRAFLTNLRLPATDHFIDVGLWGLTLAALAALLATAAIFWLLADRWWLPTVLLFGPRWVLSLPIIPLVAGALVRDRALLAPLALSAWLALGPIMGVQTGWRSMLTFGDDQRDIRVVTFNTGGGNAVTAGPNSLMAEWQADIAGFQECFGAFRRAVEAMDGWFTSSNAGFCLVSRFEMEEALTMDREALQSVGGSGHVTTHRLSTEEGPIWLTNLHLDTPRDGFEALLRGELREGIEVLRQKSLLRDIELRRAERFASQSEGPGIVVGDFNTPAESRAYRAAWKEWDNTFSVAGRGIGGTRLNGWIKARIDHVLVDDSWRVVSARLGENVGSDHLPLIATVRLR